MTLEKEKYQRRRNGEKTFSSIELDRFTDRNKEVDTLQRYETNLTRRNKMS